MSVEQLTKVCSLIIFILIQLNTTEVFADQVLSVTSEEFKGSSGRIKIDTLVPRDYHIFKMQNPDRIVIDFKNTAMAQRATFQISDRGLVLQARYAKRGDNDLRIVLDTHELLRFEHALEEISGSRKTSLVIRAFPSDFLL